MKKVLVYKNGKISLPIFFAHRFYFVQKIINNYKDMLLNRYNNNLLKHYDYETKNILQQ